MNCVRVILSSSVQVGPIPQRPRVAAVPVTLGDAAANDNASASRTCDETLTSAATETVTFSYGRRH